MSYDPNADAFNRDNYINKYAKQKKDLPISIIFTALLAVIVIGIVCAGTDTANPQKLIPDRTGAVIANPTGGDVSVTDEIPVTSYEPAIFDKAGVISDQEKLMAKFTEYYELSGVCPVFISCYDEDWVKAGYKDVGTYANKYATFTMNDNVFVILYSVPGNEKQRTHFSCAGFRGNEAGKFVTDSVYEHMNKIIVDVSANGTSATDVFVDAFEYAKNDANSRINPNQSERTWYLIKKFMPAIIATVIFTVVLVILTIKYIKDHKKVYEGDPRNDPRFV